MKYQELIFTLWAEHSQICDYRQYNTEQKWLSRSKWQNKHYNLYIFVKICKMVIQLHISSIASLIHLVAVKPYWHMKGQNPSVISPEFRCFVTVYYLGFFKRLFCCSCYTFFYSCAAYLFIQTSHIYWSLDFFFNGNCQTVKSYITIIQIFLHLKRNL